MLFHVQMDENYFKVFPHKVLWPVNKCVEKEAIKYSGRELKTKSITHHYVEKSCKWLEKEIFSHIPFSPMVSICYDLHKFFFRSVCKSWDCEWTSVTRLITCARTKPCNCSNVFLTECLRKCLMFFYCKFNERDR